MEWSQNIFPDHLKTDIKSLRSFCNIYLIHALVLYLFQRRPRKEWIWLAHHGWCLLRRSRSTLPSLFLGYSCLTHTWICQPLNKEKIKIDLSHPVATTIYFTSSKFTFTNKRTLLCLQYINFRLINIKIRVCGYNKTLGFLVGLRTCRIS